jgi:hypothetical protein
MSTLKGENDDKPKYVKKHTNQPREPTQRLKHNPKISPGEFLKTAAIWEGV